MKKILITGAGSYIGLSVERYLAQWPEEYRVDTLDMQQENWREFSFRGYDSVFHVAGIAHTRETKENKDLFFRINQDLTREAAEKARAEGVRQFIYLSSMSVYGIDQGAIDPYGPVNPRSSYGKSKLQGEEAIVGLRSDSFAVAILRPPMVYGEGCKGNYQHLIKFARIMPFFPDYENRRSVCSIENLAEFVKARIDRISDGLFFPEDPEHICTCRMVRQLAAGMGRSLPLLKILNPAVVLAKCCTEAGRKAFGDLYYERKEQQEML